MQGYVYQNNSGLFHVQFLLLALELELGGPEKDKVQR